MTQLTFEVPSGIGDITWCYQKVYDLLNVSDVSFKICGDRPHRGSSFCDLLPGVTNLGYGRSYSQTLRELLPFDTDLSTLADGTYALALNPYLESGGQLDTAFPAQRAKYHFPMAVGDSQEQQAARYVEIARQSSPYVVGFYCSSFAHRRDLGFWSVDEWCYFLREIQELLPNVHFIALGAAYDDRTFDVYTRCVRSGMHVTSALGTVDIGMTIKIIEQLDYFFAFPSGLGILADVVDTPCLMWYWSNLIPENEKFLNTYADPVNVVNGRHLNLPYLKVLPSIDIFEARGLPHVLGTA